MPHLATVALLLFAASLMPPLTAARAVNLSSVWVLPEEGYPVFYRYFRDRITWYEAEAVCQFHHAQLLTVDSNAEFDAARAYLRELDVTNLVWTGLKRSSPTAHFMWPESRAMDGEGYWAEEVPRSEGALCAAIDPQADFRWLPLPCSGPQAAAFLCQMQVPSWALREDGCMLTSLPSLTVTFLPEQGAVELVSDCGLEGTRRIACKGQANHDEMMKQLSCESSTEAASSDSWEEQPTRHRRESEVTPDMQSTVLNTTQGMWAAAAIEEATSTARTTRTEPTETTTTTAATTTTTAATTTTTAATTTSTARATTVIVTTGGGTTGGSVVKTTTESGGSSTMSAELRTTTKGSIEWRENLSPRELFAGLASDTDTTGGGNLGGVKSSKPIPPSLRGNSPFVEVPSSTPGGGGNSTEEYEGPADSHEAGGTEDLPDRPNRGRLLVRPHHHSFYPYFLNRVLG